MWDRARVLSLLLALACVRVGFAAEDTAAPIQILNGVIGQQAGTVDQQTWIWDTPTGPYVLRQLDPNDFVHNGTLIQHASNTTECGGCMGLVSCWCPGSDIGTISLTETNGHVLGPVQASLPATCVQGEQFLISGRPAGMKFWGCDTTNSPVPIGPAQQRRQWGVHTEIKATAASIPALTIFGTAATFSGVNSTGTIGGLIDATGDYRTYLTTTVLNNPAGLEGITGAIFSTRRDQQSRATWTVKADAASLAQQRIWIGWFSADPTTSDTPAGSYAALRYSTTASDTKWQLRTSDGAASGGVDTTVTVVLANRYDITLDFSVTTEVRATVNGVSVSTSSNLPALSTELFPVMRIACNTNPCGSGRTFAWSQFAGDVQ